jgi:site-specific recombinase XerD
VPIDEALFEILAERSRERMGGRLFACCYGAFKRNAPRTGLNFPKGQLSHILRHTFASHFMMNGGNILALQRILGHANLTMTMRYAHLAPDHLQETRTLNPLSRLTVR